MKKNSLFSAWGILFIICAGLGFIPDAQGALRIFLTIVSLLFFVPPFWLLLDARRTGDKECLRVLRLISALSLGLTAALLIGSILAAVRSEFMGIFMHVLLTILSTPMMASNLWALSLFLWACLLFGSISALKKR